MTNRTIDHLMRQRQGMPMTILNKLSLIAILATIASPAQAQSFFGGSTCEPTKRPEVRVVTQPATYVIDHTLAHDEIGTKARGGNIAFGVRQYAPGLTTAEIASTANYEIGSRQTSDGAWCSTLDRVIVTLSLRSPAIVYIEKDLPTTSCAYKAVLQHELLHVDTYARTINEGKPRIIATTGALFDQEIPSASSADLDESRANLISKAQQSVDLAVRSVLQFATELNQAIDTPEEYARVQASCTDWIR